MRVVVTWLAVFANWAVSSAMSINPPTKVVVTGASGKTGRLVFEVLLEHPDFQPLALVRSEQSAKALRKEVPNTGLDQVIICDITKLSDETDTLSGLQGCEAMVICTSAMPVLSKRSLVSALLKVPLNMVRGKKAVEPRSMKFFWKGDQYPELVDYLGQKAQIDLAKAVGMKHVVVVGSMGGTDPNNFLNTIGKNEDGSGNGDILLWKRKAEKYLVDSGLDYTIIHPGGLKDDPPGTKDFVIDVDDKLLQNEKRSISRGDVASMCVAGLTVGKGKKIALDVITRDVEEGTSPKSAEAALETFLEENKVYDYAV